MSVEAITWALSQPVKHSSAKFVLTVMANYADADFVCWPSAALLSEQTAQDRKTVLENMRRLRDLGYLEDTGERKGTTKQVVVYRLKKPESGTVITSPTPASPASNDTENGTLPPGQQVPNSPSKSPVFPDKQSQISLETVPIFPGNSPENGTRNRKEPSGTVKEPVKRQARAQTMPILPDPPAWVPRDLWDAWLEVRKKKRAWPTVRAVQLTIEELTKWRAQGHNITEIIENSIKRGYTGLFEPKQQPKFQQKENVHDRRAATLAAFASKPAERDITADSEAVD